MPSYAEITSALTEAQEQQTATAEILRVISSSPTDLQPVLDAVAESAARVCGAADSHICLLESDVLRVVAIHGEHRPSVAVGDTLSATPATVSGRVVRERRTIHIDDFEALPETEYVETRGHIRADRMPNRTQLAVPLLREGVPLGSIVIRRHVVQPFSEKQIALLETFATQAVIAIENVRLFTETKEALEQQTATSEILRVISSSPTDVQPVFDAIVHSAVRLCDATFCNLVRVDGESLHQVAQHNFRPEARDMVRRRYPTQLTRQLANGRAILDRAVCHIPDVETELEYDVSVARAIGFRSVLAVPMFREGSPIGAIAVARAEPGPFSPKQIALLETFANQAVIAIENVRHFTEIKEALEQQTATSEILRVIASSPTDLQPVLEAVVDNAARVCGATDSTIFRLEGENLRIVARHGSLRWSQAVGDTVPVSRDRPGGRALIDRRAPP